MRRPWLVVLGGLLAVLVGAVADAQAETVYLKDGEAVEGEVVDRTADRLVVDLQGVEMTIRCDEIDRVEGGPPCGA